MKQNTNEIGVVQRVGKTLLEFLEFILSPWHNKAAVKLLQKKVDILERQTSKGLPNTEERLESMIQYLQVQIDSLKDDTNTQLDNIKKYELPKQVEEVLKQTIYISQIIRPTVEVLMRELEDEKPCSEENTSAVKIQARQDKLQETLAQIEKLTASVPNLEAQRPASLEAGKWLLTCRLELAQAVASELLSPQHPQIEVFCRNIRQYLKLLGHCLENGIEPSLLYQGIITHQDPPVETYLNAFKLIRNKHISNWESSEQVSPQAAEELRRYFSYLIDYLVNALNLR